MTQNAQTWPFSSPRLPVSSEPQEDSGGWNAVLALSIVASAAAALFVCAHWSIAVMGAVAVLVLSAIESEAFLLFVSGLFP
jgi:hypothetical protein